MNGVTYVLVAAWQGFWRNPVMSLASTLTVSLMLLLFAFFFATDRGVQAAVGLLESKVELALFLIVNTIRIAVHARRDEIEIMKLVGATDWFIRWPFILEGMLVGALGAVASLTILFVASGPVTSALLAFLDILPVSLGPTFMPQIAAIVVGMAPLLGGGGSS